MSKCDTCKFRESPYYPWKCNYISITGHIRGCEPGDACTKYEKGPRIQGDNKIYFLKNIDDKNDY